MKRIHVIGRKNHGKTQLVVELIEALTLRGLRVGTIKHTHHQHELDTPGKDSHRHRLAGAAVVGILSRDNSAVFIPTRAELSDSNRYAMLSASFSGCDLVIVEGNTQTEAAKIEVWRASQGSDPYARQDKQVLAVVTDDPLDLDTTILPRSQVSSLASWILEQVRE